MSKKQIIYPPKEGWMEQAWYLVEMSMGPNNPVHRNLFYTGFLNDGKPAGYNHFAGNTIIGEEYSISDVYYMKAVRLVLTRDDFPIGLGLPPESILSNTLDSVKRFEGKYGFLSNFWPGDRTSVEHKYQAAKCVLHEERDQVLLCRTPGQAKRLGSKVRLKHHWDNIKIQVMTDLVREKFKDPELSRMLLDTGYMCLEEGNTWGDHYWGVCNGYGENVLGKILIQVRDEIRASKSESKAEG